MQPSRSNRPSDCRRYLGIIALLGVVLSTVCFIFITRGSETVGDGVDMTRAVTGVLERCAGELSCLEEETATLVAATSPSDVVVAAREMYRKNPRTVPACHIYMHLLGAHLTAMVTAGAAPALGDSWTECGAGLIHGAFESIVFDPSNVKEIAGVIALCDGGEFAEPDMRHHSCLHAVGHGVYTAVGGDLIRGESLCMQAMPDEASFARNHPCLAGLYMVDRDERVAALDVPSNIEGWASILKHCPQSPRPDVCGGSYLEITSRYRLVETLSYLDWCLTMTEAKTCLSLLGQGVTFVQLFKDSEELDITTCLNAATERGLATTPCLEGSRQALASSGVPEDTIEDELCRLLNARGAACPVQSNSSSLDNGNGGQEPPG